MSVLSSATTTYSTTPSKIEVVSQEALRETVHWIPRLGLSFLVFFAFWIGAALLAKFLERLIRQQQNYKRVAFRMLIKVAKTVLIAIGVATALGTLGINVSALVAGLGLTGFAIGFALKDTLSNIVSGTMILLYHPFEVNDHITVAGFDGRVVDIDLRYTVLETEGKKVLIPNATLVTNPLVIHRSPTS
jgi:small conductance mechanosensitive channel